MANLESRIGYDFRDNRLLEQALTHRSHSSVNYERLEFLGDSILNFVIALAVFEKFPELSEGDLSRLRSRLVKQSTLAKVARGIDLGAWLNMGGGEKKSGGFNRDSILSDALEAIIGAVYLDGGQGAANDLIMRLFGERIGGLSASDIKKDAKTRLQEHLQGRGEPVPHYELLSIAGKSPGQVFEVECRSDVLSLAVRATGSSRRRAEQNAAKLALKELGEEG